MALGAVIKSQLSQEVRYLVAKFTSVLKRNESSWDPGTNSPSNIVVEPDLSKSILMGGDTAYNRIWL